MTYELHCYCGILYFACYEYNLKMEIKLAHDLVNFVSVHNCWDGKTLRKRLKVALSSELVDWPHFPAAESAILTDKPLFFAYYHYFDTIDVKSC